MADEAGVRPEDIDDLDDKAFEELKAGMMADDPPEDADTPPEPIEDKTETKAENRDEKGRFKKAEAQQDEDADDDLDGEPEGKSQTVPHAKFHRANERAKEEARLRKEAEDRFARLAERLAQLEEAKQPQKEPEPEGPAIPGPDDPVGRINWTVETLREQIEQQNRSRSEQEAASAEEQHWQRAQAFAAQQFAQAEQSDQELRPAYDYLLQSFQREAEAYGLQGQMLQQHLAHVEREHIRYALQNNMTIPEYIKRLATARGFAHKPAEPEPAPKPDPVQQITEREEARKASLSLGKTGGGVSNTDKLTPERLLEMSDAEFAAFKDKYGSVGAVFN